MTSVVLDTNALASGSIAADGTLATLIDLWRRDAFQVSASQEILVELERTLDKPYFRRRLTTAQRRRFLSLLRRRATIVSISVAVQGIATHPEDDLVLATAVSAHADYLITGDRQLLALGIYEGVRVVSPRAFLEILVSQEEETSD